MGQIGCSETSVSNLHNALRNIPEEGRSYDKKEHYFEKRAFSLRLFTCEARFDPRSVRVTFLMKIFAMALVLRSVLLFCPVNIIPLKLNTHLEVALTRTKGWSLVTSKKKCSSESQ
jgi:hypothetical protein